MEYDVKSVIQKIRKPNLTDNVIPYFQYSKITFSAQEKISLGIQLIW